jgi:hypothetical protein
MRVAMRWQDAARQLTLSLAPGGRMLPPARREIDVRVAGSDVHSASGLRRQDHNHSLA